jgi:hypothetical protein
MRGTIWKKDNVAGIGILSVYPSPKRFELLRGNPMYLAGTRLNHSAKATRTGHPTEIPSEGLLGRK